MEKEKIIDRLDLLVKIAHDLEKAKVMMPSDARELRVVARYLRDSMKLSPDG